MRGPELSARAYDRARNDPNTKIPTYLEVLLNDVLEKVRNAGAEQAKRDIARPEWERAHATGARDEALTR